MAMPESIMQDWEALTEDEQLMTRRYIRALLEKRRNPVSEDKISDFPFDVWRGGLKYMSADFNETPEGFEDYT